MSHLHKLKIFILLILLFLSLSHPLILHFYSSLTSSPLTPLRPLLLLSYSSPTPLLLLLLSYSSPTPLLLLSYSSPTPLLLSSFVFSHPSYHFAFSHSFYYIILYNGRVFVCNVLRYRRHLPWHAVIICTNCHVIISNSCSDVIYVICGEHKQFNI